MFLNIFFLESSRTKEIRVTR